MKTCKELGKLGYVSGGFGVVLAWFVADFGQETGATIRENVPRGTYSFCLVYLCVNHIINSKVLKIK
jgi:hypothetical protein